MEVALLPHGSTSNGPDSKLIVGDPTPDSFGVDQRSYSPAVESSYLKIKFPYAGLPHFLACADGLLIVCASFLGGGSYQLIANGNAANSEPLFGAGVIAALLYVLIGQVGGL